VAHYMGFEIAVLMFLLGIGIAIVVVRRFVGRDKRILLDASRTQASKSQ
jgi:hypothetical protein